jgi:hypothetical protein
MFDNAGRRHRIGFTPRPAGHSCRNRAWKPRVPTVSRGPALESTQKPPKSPPPGETTIGRFSFPAAQALLTIPPTADARHRTGGQRRRQGHVATQGSRRPFCPVRMFLIENFPADRNEKPVRPFDWIGRAAAPSRGWGRLTLRIRNLQCVDSPRMTENKLAERERVVLWRQKTIICWIN